MSNPPVTQADAVTRQELRALQLAVLELAIAQGKIANAVLTLSIIGEQATRGASLLARSPIQRARADSDQAFRTIARVAEKLEKALGA